MRVVTTLFALLLSSPAVAQEGHAQNGPVFVFRGDTEFQDGFDLIASGMAKKNPAALAVLLACSVEEGTPIYSLRVGERWGTRWIMVTGGPQEGCKGIVLSEQVSLP